MSRRRNELVGKIFGKLTVQKYVRIDKFGNSVWLCLCLCGKTVEVSNNALPYTAKRRCAHKRAPRGERYGLTGCISLHAIPEYRSWYAMKARCYNPKHTCYKYYGGRGIQVCPLWKESFGEFLSYMGKKPSPTHSIDRIDVNGHYEPGNCRWATRSEQNRNRRPLRHERYTSIGDV